jgi:hypothetical protein
MEQMDWAVMRLTTLASAFALLALYSVTPASAGALVYTFDQDGCTGTCGLSNYGTVTVTDLLDAGNNPAGVNIKVALKPGLGMLDTGVLSKYTLVFALDGGPTVNLTGLPSGWSYTAANLNVSGGWGTFNELLSCEATCGQSAGPWTLGLDFNITDASITTASFIDSGTESDTYFMADISNPNGGNALTGRIGASYTGVPTDRVPEPVTMSLFGAGLAGLAALRRRRRAKA